jgi:hypothetical protein
LIAVVSGQLQVFRRGGALPAFSLSVSRDPLRLLAPVLQVISLRGDLAKTLLWLVLRIPATHWYKGDTAFPALVCSAAMRRLRQRTCKSQPSCRRCPVLGTDHAGENPNKGVSFNE